MNAYTLPRRELLSLCGAASAADIATAAKKAREAGLQVSGPSAGFKPFDPRLLTGARREQDDGQGALNIRRPGEHQQSV